MKHTPSHVIIYSKYEYDDFEMILGNRKLNTEKIGRIIKEIKSGNDMLKYYPIQVSEKNNKLSIIDGQHRFSICQKLGLPVYYIVVKEVKSIGDIAKVNSNVDRWKINDYIECYIANGNKHYQVLKDFLARHPLAIGFALKILAGEGMSSETNTEAIIRKFQKGDFEVIDMPAAENICEKINLFSFYPGRYKRPFAVAIKLIAEHGLVPIEDIAEACRKRPELLIDQSNYKNFIYKLEEIYNIGKHSRTVIYTNKKKAVKETKPKKEISRRAKEDVLRHSRKIEAKKAETKKFKTLDPNQRKTIPLKIDHKTTIYIAPGQNPLEEKLKYLKSLDQKKKNLKNS